ncbi:BQ5605_C001g00057 [Microbotryum silenes-dioicae]|uniref:DNA replication complex GINS protein PSF1 n=1 Tax=Microbotryum silenes-dioicae TaxID=796604 RepID=A0A2X0M6J5_9BASI|nr:BQ5605_C001g00057 [Microbotryum silenes-dioicae]
MLGDHANLLVLDSHRSIQTRTLQRYAEPTLRALIRECHHLADPVERAVRMYDPSQASPNAIPEMPQDVFAEMRLLSLALQRNRRALEVYALQRIEILKTRYWEMGGNLGKAFGTATEVRGHMVVVDEAFAKGYADLCLKFKTGLYNDPDDDEDDDEQEDGDEQDEEGNLELDEEEDVYEGREERRARRQQRRPRQRPRRGGAIAGDPTSLMDAIDLLGGGIDQEPPKDLFLSVRVLKDVGDVETLSGARLSLTKGSQYFLPREDVEQMVVLGEVEVID